MYSFMRNLSKYFSYTTLKNVDNITHKTSDPKRLNFDFNNQDIRY